LSTCSLLLSTAFQLLGGGTSSNGRKQNAARHVIATAAVRSLIILSVAARAPSLLACQPATCWADMPDYIDQNTI
jgi:hypothetical protein